MAGRGERRWRLVRARRDAVPASLRRLSHTVTARRPRLRRFRYWLFGALGAALLGAVGYLVLGTSALGVATIEITGSHIASPAEVREVAAVAIGTPLARVDTDEVARRVRTLPSVASVEISRSWPSTLVIAVTERTAVAMVKSHSGYLLLDGEGVVFSTAAVAPEGLVLVRVAEPGAGDPATRAAMRVVAALTPRLRAEVGAIVAASASNIRLELRDGRTVVWGDAERSDDKARVATALLGKATKFIDVSTPEVAAVS